MKKIYTAYALVLFALILTIALIPYGFVRMLSPYHLKIRHIYAINAVIMRIWSPLTGFKCKVANESLVEKKRTYIVISNHYSMFDMLAIAHSLSIPGKSLVKRELLKIPIFGWLLSAAAISVKRSDKESRKRTMLLMEEDLGKGISLLIFPEGTRNKSGEALSDFKAGAFKLAALTGTPILPIVTLNTRDKSHPVSLAFEPAQITLQYLEPIDPAVYANDPEKMKNICYKNMEAAILQNDPHFKT
ncbi:MAG: 1-acyl-sn-glycerol-3-phosphate acyltransferase [Bacteroidetes bacterium]|nr:1-acyl-sn-glycerol-3-phosphate acyltransferase [Bacteroidota bacterium]